MQPCEGSPNLPVYTPGPQVQTGRDLLLECIKETWCGCRGLDMPSVREILAGAVTQSPGGCLALNVTLAPVPTIDVTGVLCGGTTETITVKDEADTKVFIDGVKSPIPVCIVGEKDFAEVYKCDSNTGNTILIRTVLDQDTSAFVTTYFDLVLGADWAGNPADLTECTSNTLESDKVKLCDDNGEFYRWFVKDNGEPTGVSYDTDLSGAPYVPVGVVGDCTPPELQLLPVCDTLTATLTGNINYTPTPYNVALDLSPVVLANDTLSFFWTDFGDGYNDVGPSPDHTYEADGHYEIKSYAVTASGNKILIAAKEINVVAGVVTVNGANPHVVNRSYSISVGSAMQEYSGTTPVGTPINPDGSAYTVQGTLAWSCPVVIDELEDNAEWNPENVADLVECVVGSANLVTEGLDGNITAAASVVIGGSPNAIVHTLLGNTLAINGAGTNGASSAGLNVNISGGTFSAAQFTFNINVIGDEDPLDSADMGIAVWDNVAGISVTATTITSSLSYLTDAQGVGLNMPIYAYPSTGSHTIVWTGDLPAGDYTVILLTQDLGVLDMIELSVDHNIVSGPTTTTKAQLVALDQCTIDALTPEPVVTPVVGLTKTVQRLAAPYVVATNYSSATITSISADVTIDGVSIPAGFTWSVDSSTNQIFTDTVSITGTDYIVTEVR